MPNKHFITSLLAAGLVLFTSSQAVAHAAPQTKVNPHAASQVGTDPHTIAYVLLDNQVINDMLATLNLYDPTVSASKLFHCDRMILSFLDPAMDPDVIAADMAQLKNDPDNKAYQEKFMKDLGMPGIEYIHLTTMLADLRVRGMSVYFSVGGWAYSDRIGDLNKGSLPNFGVDSTGNGNFPFTPDMLADYAKLGLTYDPSIQTVDENTQGKSFTTTDFTNAWVSVAKFFGMQGLDLDYEENWYSGSYVLAHPIGPVGHNWSLQNTYSTVKYGVYLHDLEQSAQAAGLKVSIAAPAIGSFNIHDMPIDAQGKPDPLAGNWYYVHGITSATLKGVIYDMANWKTIKDFAAHQADYGAIFTLNGKNILDQANLNKLGVMTYDLDDGYVNGAVDSYWCLGWQPGPAGQLGYPVARAPDGYDKIDCSITSQAVAIMRSYNKALSGLSSPAELNAGIEVAYPNYPVNIDPSLPGGGSDTADVHYRWNDPYMPFDIPLVKDIDPDHTKFSIANSQKIVAAQGAHDGNPTHNNQQLFVVHDYLKQLKSLKNADGTQMVKGVIVWSLDNQEYRTYIENKRKTEENFAKDLVGYQASDLLLLLENAASSGDILKETQAGFPMT